MLTSEFSQTLTLIMTYWNTPILPATDFNTIDLPFDIEGFCRENDAVIAKLREDLRKLNELAGNAVVSEDW